MTFASRHTSPNVQVTMSELPPHISSLPGAEAPVRTGAGIRARLRYQVGVFACCAAVAGLGVTAGVAAAKDDPVPAPGVTTVDDHGGNSGTGSNSGSDDSSGKGRGRGSDDPSGSGLEPGDDNGAGIEPGDDNGGTTTTVEPGDDNGGAPLA